MKLRNFLFGEMFIMPKWLFTWTSAFLLSIAFLAPQVAGFLVLIAFGPLFYRSILGIACPGLEGFAWGLIFYGVAMNGVAIMLYQKMEGPFRLGGYVVLVLYYAVQSAAWFWLTERIKKMIGGYALYRGLFVWTVTTIIYLWFIDTKSLWILGRAEGYPFVHILLPLASKPVWLWSVSWLGHQGVLIGIITGCAGVAWWWHERRGAFLIMGFFPVLVGWVIPRTDEQPVFLGRIGYIKPPEGNHEFPPEIGCRIEQDIEKLCAQYPIIRLIVMPESTCRFPLNEYRRCTIARWGRKEKNDTKLIMGNKEEVNKKADKGNNQMYFIIGSHRTDNKMLFNTCYFVNSCRIIQTYDKQNLIPFGECFPPLWQNVFPFLKEGFIDDRILFDRGSSTSPVMNIHLSHNQHLRLKPLICSELFFAPSPPSSTEKIIALVNDGWVDGAPYMQRLLLYTATLRAVEWGVPILYVAHSGAWWISQQGYRYPLRS